MAHKLTPAQRSLRARIASLTRISSPDYDPKLATKAANEGKWRKYEAQVDPDNRLPISERHAKAIAAWRADMLKGRLKKSMARTAKLNRLNREAA